MIKKAKKKSHPKKSHQLVAHTVLKFNRQDRVPTCTKLPLQFLLLGYDNTPVNVLLFLGAEVFSNAVVSLHIIMMRSATSNVSQ